MDKKLRGLLFQQYYAQKGVDYNKLEKLEKEGKTNYTSGRKIKYNDVIIFIFVERVEETKFWGHKIKGAAFDTVYLHVDEIDDFCKKHTLLKNKVDKFLLKHKSLIKYHINVAKNENYEEVQTYYTNMDKIEKELGEITIEKFFHNKS